ncbi:uroporphyrinogen-III synthase [Brachybacterium halotolerans subsp. kimchii]|uniref:uroporphyrinogen-III synthase n=1 Tax=Brachybacterium halotolerans TaxID=2795215 RepID=UPI001E4EA24E|nr:uroporphyrinogen-III synthase [Brachybacterium halotolerans]UEJ84195.1 uroporphyrinogen-III synthase [Brachybacterium halotolerans subsp. kimchii]
MSRDRVLLPRPEGRGDDLTDLLEIAGYDVVRAPFVRIEPAPAADLAPALDRLARGEYDLLVITSPATVRSLVAVGLQVPEGTEVVAVGGATARALHEAGLEVDLVAEGSGAALVEAVRRRREAVGSPDARPELDPDSDSDSDPTAPGPVSAPAPAPRVLLPASSAAAPTVREGLEGAGMHVEQVDAYHPEHAPLPAEVERDLPGGGFDAIVLTSSMIARRAAQIGVHPRTAVVVIGRPTEEAALSAGLQVDARAEHPDAPSLARAVHLALAPETTALPTTSPTSSIGPTSSTSPAAPKE